MLRANGLRKRKLRNSLTFTKVNQYSVCSMLKTDISIPTHSYSSVSSLTPPRPSPQHYYSAKPYTNYVRSDDVVSSYCWYV